VEVELRTKSEQIAKLQNYLKEEIANIQAIVNDNNSLKKENELIRSTLATTTKQQQETAKEVQMLTQLNKESSAIIRRL
jgi:regulator of replication initiation timing